MALAIQAEKLGPATTTSVASGASAQLCAANTERNGLNVMSDPSGTGTVYILLGTGTASATNWHVALAPGGSWDGRLANDLWAGAAQFFGTGARVAVVEA